MALPEIPSRFSFRKQIILTYVVGFCLLICAFAAFLIITERDNLHRDSVNETTSMAQALAASALPWVLADDVAGLQESVHAFRAYPEFNSAMVMSPSGRVLGHSDPSRIGKFLTDEQSQALIKAPHAIRVMEDSANIIDVAVPIEINGRQVGWARVTSTKLENNANLRAMILENVGFVVMATLLSLIAAVLIANRLGTRIASLVAVAEGVQAGNVSARASAAGGEDEVGKLGASLNQMLDTLAQNQQALRTATHYTRSLIEASLDPLVTISAEGKITDVNRATEKATGLNRSALIGTDFSDYFTEPDQAREGYRQVFAQGYVADYPLTLRHHEGHLTKVLYNATVYRDEAGKVLGVFAAARDVTERDKAEAALRDSEALLQATLKWLPVGLWIIGADGNIVFSNDAAKQIWAGARYVGVEQLGVYKGWRVDTGKLVEPHEWAGMRALETGETIIGEEIEIECFDGTRKIILDSAVPLRNADGSMRCVITINQDITERKRTELSLQQSEEVLKEAQRIAHLGSWHMDVATSEVFWSEELYKIYGFDPALPPPLYTESMKLFTPESWDKLNASIAQATEAGVAYEIELETALKDGNRGWMWARGEPVYDAHGKVVRVRGVVMDITERKKLETQARQSAAYTRSLIEASLDPLVTISAEGKITDVNRATEQATGRSRAELVGTDFADYFTEPDKARAGYQQVFASGFVTNYPLALRHLDGHIMDVLYNASVYRDEDGKVLGVFAAAREVTESLRVRKELEESEQKFRTLAEAMPQIVWITRPDGWNIYFNQQWVDYTGMTLEESYGHGWNKPFHPDDQKRAWDAWQNATRTDSVYSLECRLRRADGAYRWWLIRGVSLHDASGKIVNWFGTCTDIEDIKQSETEIREKEERLSLATMINGVGIWDWNLVSQEMIWDDSMYALYHMRREDFIGTEEAWRKSLHPDDLARGDKEVADAIAGIKPFDTEFRVVWPNGEIHHIKAVAKVFRDEQGKAVRMLGTNLDITETKKAEQALFEAQQVFRALIENSPDIIARYDRDCRRTYVNPTYLKTTQIPEQELLATSPAQVSPLPKASADVLQSLLRRVLDSGIAEAVDVIWPLGGNIDTWYNIYAFPEYDREGQVVSVMTVSRDITERKRNEAINSARVHLVQFSMAHNLHELLEETLNEAERLTGSLVGFYHFVDEDQQSLTLQCWSTRTRTEFCKAEGEGLHYPISEAGVWVDCVREGRAVIHNDYASLPHRKGMPEGHAAVTRELVVPVFRGNRISAILGVGNKPSDYDDKDIETISLIADLAWEIAERKKAEDQIAELNRDLEKRVQERTAQLEAANKELEAFSYSVSHDLRTPLRAIDGFSHILIEDYTAKLDDEGKRLLHVVRDNTSKMGQLIDDILKFSRAGRLELNFSELNLEQMAREVYEELRPSVSGHEPQVEIGPLPPARGDRAMIRQVFVNLISNAIKFTRTTEPAIIKVGARTENSETVYFVQDNGAGFDMRYVDRLFGVFQRLHTESEFEGTGIGLAIVKRIIARHGGRVWAEGHLNAGATIYFTLPAEAGTA